MDPKSFGIEIAKIAIGGAAATAALLTWTSHISDQNRQADLNFQLQAAQVVMTQKNCDAAVKKSAELRALFPDQLKNFVSGPFVLFACYAIEHPAGDAKLFQGFFTRAKHLKTSSTFT